MVKYSKNFILISYDGDKYQIRFYRELTAGVSWQILIVKYHPRAISRKQS